MSQSKECQPQIIEKPWGHEELIEVNDAYMVKRLLMKQSHQCSLQYHEHKTETVLVFSGNLSIVLEDKTITLSPGQAITLTPGTIHRMHAKDQDCVYFECSTPNLDDVVRVEDDYDRI